MYANNSPEISVKWVSNVCYIQKSAPELSPALLKNATTTMVVMPFKGADGWSQELETIKQDLFKRRQKECKAA